MPKEVDLYDGHYGQLDADPLVAVRRETYDEDLGQASWITLAEARQFFRALELSPGRSALEVACGSGGVLCRMALETGASCVGVDINAEGIEAATRRAHALLAESGFLAGQRRRSGALHCPSPGSRRRKPDAAGCRRPEAGCRSHLASKP